MNHKELYVLLDSDGDIVETFSENSTNNISDNFIAQSLLATDKASGGMSP